MRIEDRWVGFRPALPQRTYIRYTREGATITTYMQNIVYYFAIARNLAFYVKQILRLCSTEGMCCNVVFRPINKDRYG